MIDTVTKWFQTPSGGLVDKVAWFLRVLGAAGFVMVPVQLVALSSTGIMHGKLPLLALSVINFAVFLALGIGLMRRRPWARRAFLAYLMLGGAWQLYWAIAINKGWRIPFIMTEPFQTNLRWPFLAVTLLWTGVYVWLGFRFTRPDIVSQFSRR